MKHLNLKTSAHFLSIACTIVSVFSMIVDVGAIILLGGTLLSQIMRPGYLAAQMIHAEMDFVFSEWVTLLICFILKCSFIVYAIRSAKKLFFSISKEESPFTAGTTKLIKRISIFVFLALICPLYPYYHLSLVSIIESAFVALILCIISLIFEYGCGLQKEIDETL